MGLVKRALDRIARDLGYQNRSPASDGSLRRSLLMKTLGIETVFDVGANSGQYGGYLRERRFTGRIISYEPLSKPFARLSAAAAADGAWDAHQMALSDADGETEINVSITDTWSSFLPRDDKTTSERLEYMGVEKVRTARLDSVAKIPPRSWLKLDVQGFELHVLAGAEKSLPLFAAAECEIMLEPSYVGAPNAKDLVGYFYDHGFKLATALPGRVYKTGRSSWIDAIFERA